jgi:hypothetical protein
MLAWSAFEINEQNIYILFKTQRLIYFFTVLVIFIFNKSVVMLSLLKMENKKSTKVLKSIV